MLIAFGLEITSVEITAFQENVLYLEDCVPVFYSEKWNLLQGKLEFISEIMIENIGISHELVWNIVICAWSEKYSERG